MSRDRLPADFRTHRQIPSTTPLLSTLSDKDGFTDMSVHRRTSHWLPALLVLSLASGIAMRAAAPQPPQSGTAPAMVRFYGVDGAGMSAPENPLDSGFALDSSASFTSVSRSSGAPGQAEEAGQTRQEHSVPLSIRLEYPSQRRKDSFRRQFDEFQCERHGFFYTARGRCVVPARRQSTRISGDHPVSRHRHTNPVRSPLPPAAPVR